jgi:hypothetical protein
MQFYYTLPIFCVIRSADYRLCFYIMLLISGWDNTLGFRPVLACQVHGTMAQWRRRCVNLLLGARSASSNQRKGRYSKPSRRLTSFSTCTPGRSDSESDMGVAALIRTKRNRVRTYSAPARFGHIFFVSFFPRHPIKMILHLVRSEKMIFCHRYMTPFSLLARFSQTVLYFSRRGWTRAT